MAVNRRLVLGLLASACATGAFAAPQSKLLDRRWTLFGRSDGPDHARWREILRAGRKMGSDGIARFDYGGVDPAAVSAYVRDLEALDPAKLHGHGAFAYWVNLYNAATVEVVQNAYPVESIRKIGGGVFARGPWQAKRLTVQGQSLSLDDIEHGILRPIWKDPRVHYAVNCAALGCPNLAAAPYDGRSYDAMLNAAAKAYINHPRGVSVQGDAVELSSIYDWYGEDFGDTAAQVLGHISTYAEPKLAKALSSVRKISGYTYNWALNDV